MFDLTWLISSGFDCFTYTVGRIDVGFHLFLNLAISAGEH
jgi:hypothetical protein